MRPPASVAALLLTLVLPEPSLALIGHGIEMYNPLCAFSCRAAIASAMLTCSDHDMAGGAHSGHGGSGATTPDCRASDSPFLTTLAWCIGTTCAESKVEAWKLEKYWREKTTGDKAVAPKWTLGQALEEVTEPPTRELGEDEMLNFTAQVSQEAWAMHAATMEYFEWQETLHARYGVVLLVVGFATPVVFSLLNYLPYMTGIYDKFRPYIVYPTTIGTYHVRSLPYLLGNPPTIGQTLYIVVFAILNLILSAVNYKSSGPNAWFGNSYQEIMGYVSCRTGVLAFALLPLTILFSGRNNILLWTTNWSHSTYILLHRWIARICGVQIIVHSIVELVLYIDQGTYAEELPKPYWVWGCVATVAACIMLVFSLLWFRRRWSYEIFLIGHILMAVFVLVGSWYHVEILFYRKWGYEFWLYAACAVWFADRVLRVARLLKNGLRRATVRELGESGVVRVDVPGLRWKPNPGMHTYAYFPAAAPLRPWENHPFSVVPTALFQTRSDSSSSSVTNSSTHRDVEKGNETTSAAAEIRQRAIAYTTAGVTLFVRKSGGLTKALKSHASLLTLLDGPYPNNSTASVRACDRLVLIGGGIGITGLLAFAAHHANAKLYWTVRAGAEALVAEVEPVMAALAEREVRIGSRLEVEALLAEEERGGWRRIGVVVCGPGALCDDVRAVVARKGREGKATWILEVDAFSW